MTVPASQGGGELSGKKEPHLQRPGDTDGGTVWGDWDTEVERETGRSGGEIPGDSVSPSKGTSS